MDHTGPSIKPVKLKTLSKSGDEGFCMKEGTRKRVKYRGCGETQRFLSSGLSSHIETQLTMNDILFMKKLRKMNVNGYFEKLLG